MHRRTFLRSLAALALAPAAAPLLKLAPKRKLGDITPTWRNWACTYDSHWATYDSVDGPIEYGSITDETLASIRRAMRLTDFKPPDFTKMPAWSRAPRLMGNPDAVEALYRRAGLV
jgi:hypothetical protein